MLVRINNTHWLKVAELDCRQTCSNVYGSEICTLRKAEQNLLERTEMRMLRWMMGIKRIKKE